MFAPQCVEISEKVWYNIKRHLLMNNY